MLFLVSSNALLTECCWSRCTWDVLDDVAVVAVVVVLLPSFCTDLVAEVTLSFSKGDSAGDITFNSVSDRTCFSLSSRGTFNSVSDRTSPSDVGVEVMVLTVAVPSSTLISSTLTCSFGVMFSATILFSCLLIKSPVLALVTLI